MDDNHEERPARRERIGPRAWVRTAGLVGGGLVAGGILAGTLTADAATDDGGTSTPDSGQAVRRAARQPGDTVRPAAGPRPGSRRPA
jgi:hypothetical protein